MRYLASQKVRYAIAFLVGSVIGIGYVFSAVGAHADTITGVSIAGNGLAIVRGAQITQVSADQIIAVSKWGKTSFQWRLITDGNTRFAPERNGRTLSAMFSVGQIIDFTGQMEDGDGPTVRVTSVHNESLMQSATLLSGSLIGVADSGILMLTSAGTSTVRINSGTILTKDGNRADPNDLQPGSAIKAFGTFDAQDNTLDADRVTSVTSTVPQSGDSQPKKPGIIQNIAAWLSMRGGALSMRRVRRKAA